MKLIDRLIPMTVFFFLMSVAFGQLDVAQASSPAGFPLGDAQSASSMPETHLKSDASLSVVVLPPNTWPGESFSPAHNPVFPSKVPLSEWSRRFSPNGAGEDFRSGLVTSSGRIFAASTSGRVEALEVSSGRPLWHVNVEGSVYTPMILSQKTLYVVTSTPSVTIAHLLFYTRTRHLIRGDGSERIWALSQRSGRILWTKKLPGAVLGSPLLEPHTIALSTGDGHLLFLSRIDGHKVVDIPVSDGSFGWASPLNKPDAIYVAQENPPMIDRVGKFPLKTDWRFSLSQTRTFDRFFIGAPVWTPEGVACVFRVKDSGRVILVSLDGVTGRLLWKRSISGTSPNSPEEVLSSVFSDGVLYVPSPDTGEILAVSEDGHLLWRTHIGGHPHTGGTILGRLLFLPLPSGHIVALDRTSGEKVYEWVGKSPLGPRSLPIIGSMIFFADRNGWVRALAISSFGEKADRLSRAPFLNVSGPLKDRVGGKVQ